MAGNANHIIHTICLDTHATSEEIAYAFADKIKNMGIENWLRKILSKYDQLPGTIRIDQLSIDIGTIDPGDMEGLEELLTGQLDELLAGKLIHTNAGEKTISLAGEQEIVSGPETVESKAGVLLHYLLTGSLPWNVTGKPDMEELLQEMLEKEPIILKRWITPVLNRPGVIKRLAIVFKFSTIEMLTEKIVGKPENAAVREIISLLKKHLFLTGPLNRRELSIVILKALNESFSGHKRYSEVFIDYLEKIFEAHPAHSLRSLVIPIEQLRFSAAIADRVIYTSVLEQLRQSITGRESSLEQKKIITIKNNRKNENDNPKSPDVATQAVIDKKDADPLFEEGQGQEHYFIDNAGMVLLNAGLLHKYFEQLDWVRDKAIVNETARHKIMLWLDWLVWGKHKVHEYELLLNKVMVGLHPSDICDIHISLNQLELDAGKEFLETIIRHWSLLKSTSIDGLRTSFLQRDARMADEDGGWQLHAASKGYDILIDSLPWSFSIIKLPWMTKPLYTQWQTKT